jgi:hypothetical protein
MHTCILGLFAIQAGKCEMTSMGLICLSRLDETPRGKSQIRGNYI